MTADEDPAQRLRAAFESLSGTLDARTVQSSGTDPFRIAHSTDRTDSAWLADQVATLGLPASIHNRGLHYVLVTAAPTKPDGSTYRNTEADWNWLEKTSKAARWLGYVPFDAITDERNAPPVFRDSYHFQPSGGTRWPDISTMTPTVALDDFSGRQRFRLAIIGEKSSLEPVLGPIADEFDADLLLPTGNLSNTMVYQLACSAADDGRPLRVFYLSDCDPSGWGMPIEVGRKLQAFKTGWFPELEFCCYRVGLTPDHVTEYDLPTSPIKETDKRGVPWKQAFGVEQTEIDALATLQPDLLETIVRDAISPFYDFTLAERVRDVERRWLSRAQAALIEALGPDMISNIAALNDRLRRAQASVSIDLVPPDEPRAMHDPNRKRPIPMINSQWDFKKQTEKLQAARSYTNTSKRKAELEAQVAKLRASLN